MQRRLLGSVIVVAAGLVPTLIGGPVFALLMLGLGIVSLREFLTLNKVSVASAIWILFGALVLVVGGAHFSQPILLFIAIVLGVSVPLAMCLPLTTTPGTAEAWSWGTAGVFYIGLPVFAAVTLRQASGNPVPAAWQTFAERLALGWPPAPLGLVWTLAVVLSTWAGDSAAYLAGRAFGRNKLAPSISPGKTVEGSAGGLVATIVVSAAVFSLSGTLPAWAGALVGAVLGVCGQLGDLSESFLKRQAGAKDSGDLIPGHGGVLDRIDALLFAFPAALLMYWIAEGGLRW